MIDRTLTILPSILVYSLQNISSYALLPVWKASQQVYTDSFPVHYDCPPQRVHTNVGLKLLRSQHAKCQYPPSYLFGEKRTLDVHAGSKSLVGLGDRMRFNSSLSSCFDTTSRQRGRISGGRKQNDNDKKQRRTQQANNDSGYKFAIFSEQGNREEEPTN